MKNYFFTYKKRPLVAAVLVVFIIDVFFVWLYLQRGDLQIPINDITIKNLLLLGKILLGIWLVFGLISALVNAKIISELDPNAKLEINNEKRYLLYTNVIDGETKQAKANFDDIYLLKYNKAKFVNLCFYEILYVENGNNKKVVISIAIVDNLEKKIDKTIKLIKEEVTFFDEFPKTTY